MSGKITRDDLDHFERTLEALALECKITDEDMFNLLAIHGACVAAAVDKERERCCGIVYGQCGSDNVAERTVRAIRKQEHKAKIVMWKRSDILQKAARAEEECLRHNQVPQVSRMVVVDTVARLVLDNAATVAERYGDAEIEDAINELKNDFTIGKW